MHHQSDFYVALVGHPLFGRKVQVVQIGETDTTQWALIAHPDNPELRYRIGQRWLQSKQPAAPDVYGRKSLELSLDYSQLVELANFISEKRITINDLHSVSLSTTLVGTKNPTRKLDGNESSQTGLGADSSKANRSIELEATGSLDIDNQGER